MRIVFMGTPEFAVPTLHMLLESKHEVVAVYTAPPRPANRGKKLTHSPVHMVAEQAGVPVFTPHSLRGDEAQAEFAALKSDIAVVVAYGLLLPNAILNAPKYGCLNIHPSDLPRWRGAAPIQRSIMAGDEITAICIMQMDSGLDTGAVWRRVELNLPYTATEWEAELAEKSSKILLDVLTQIEAGQGVPIPQANEGITYAHKIDKSEYALHFDAPVAKVLHHIHGVSPYGYVMLDSERVRIIKAKLAEGLNGAKQEQIINSQFHIQCSDGKAVAPIILQREGKKAVDINDFLNGLKIDLVGKLLS
jgi:methionyl-tRNA formyltransferase